MKAAWVILGLAAFAVVFAGGVDLGLSVASRWLTCL